MSQTRLLVLSAAVLTLGLPQPAMADCALVTAGAALSLSAADDPAAQGNLSLAAEGERANVYLGAALNLYGDATDDEVALSFGYRDTTAQGLSYDLSYTRYLYPFDGGDCCGSLALTLDKAFGDRLSATFDAGYDFGQASADARLTLDYALNDKLTLSGDIGIAQNAGASDTWEWALSANYALGAETAAGLHYVKASDAIGYLSLDLTWDATLFGG